MTKQVGVDVEKLKVFSLDVKGWDKSLHADLFDLVKEFNEALLRKGGGE